MESCPGSSSASGPVQISGQPQNVVGADVVVPAQLLQLLNAHFAGTVPPAPDLLGADADDLRQILHLGVAVLDNGINVWILLHVRPPCGSLLCLISNFCRIMLEILHLQRHISLDFGHICPTFICSFCPHHRHCLTFSTQYDWKFQDSCSVSTFFMSKRCFNSSAPAKCSKLSPGGTPYDRKKTLTAP